MPPGRFRRRVVRPVVWLLVAAAVATVALVVLARSPFAAEQARRLLEARLTEGIGRSVTIERVELELVPVSIVAHRLAIAGLSPEDPPFLAVERLEVDADLGALRSSRIVLRQILASGLELDLDFGPAGFDNLPRPPGGGGKSFEVEIGAVEVDDSRVHLQERTLPLSFAARGVRGRFVGIGDGSLDGRLDARAIDLELPEARPIEVGLAARVRLEGARLNVLEARIRAPDLDLAARGPIALSAGSTGRLAVELSTSTSLLERLGWIADEIAGDARFTGEVSWTGSEWTVSGDLRSRRLDIVGFGLSELQAGLEVNRERADLALRSARWADGTLFGTFEVALASPYRARLAVEAVGADLDAVASRFELPVERLVGRLSGPFDYEFDLLDAERGLGRGDFSIGVDRVGDRLVEAAGRVGIALADGQAILAPIRWRAVGQTITGSGRVGIADGTGELDLHVASEELGRLASRLPFLAEGDLWRPTAGTGEIDLALRLEGGGRFLADVDLAAGALVAPGASAQRVAARLHVTEQSLVIEELRLEDPGASLRVTGALPFDEAVPFAVTVEIDGWPIAAARPWVDFDLPIEGRARGLLHVGGTLAAPTGRLDAVAQPVEVAGLAGQRLAVELDWNGERVEVEQARMDFAAGGVEANGRLTFADEGLDFVVASPALALGSAPLDVASAETLSGRLVVDGTVGGTLAAPRLHLRGEAADAAFRGVRLDRPAELAIDWAEDVLAARLAVPELVAIEGGGRLTPEADARLEFRFSSPRLERLLAVAGAPELPDLDGDLVAGIAVDWPAGGEPTIDFEIPQLAASWRGHRLSSLEPLRAHVGPEGTRIESVYLSLGGEDEELFLGGRIGAEDDPELDLHLQANLSAGWLEPFLVEAGFAAPGLAGRIDLLATIGGTLASPAWSGQGSWRDGRLIPQFLPHSFDRIGALVLLYPRAVVLDRMSGELAGGTLTASGRADLVPGDDPTYRFEVAGRRLDLRWPPGWQVRGDVDLTLASTDAGRQIVGQAELDRVYTFQDVDLSPAQLVERLLARSRVVVPQVDEFLATTGLNVGVRAPRSVRVRNNLAEITATAELAVRGSLARPVVFGEVRAEEGSKAFYGGNEYRIERALLAFTDATAIDPQLDVVASTRVDQYDVRVLLGGKLSRPVTSFASDPPLPDLEILGLLTTGTAGEPSFASGSASGSEQRSAAAEALLYGQAASLVGQRVGQLFGFDRVRVEPLTSGDAVSAARVTVGKRLSRKVFVTYSYDPSSTAQQILQVDWRLSDSLVLVLSQNGNESYAVDARWETRF